MKNNTYVTPVAVVELLTNEDILTLSGSTKTLGFDDFDISFDFDSL